MPSQRTLVKSSRVILFAVISALFTSAIGQVGEIPDPTLAVGLTAALEFGFRIVRGWLGAEPIEVPVE